MTAQAKRVWISLALYLMWIIITTFGARLMVGDEADLSQLVSNGIGWHFLLAIALLLAAIVGFKWRDMKFTQPHSLVRVMWLPGLYLVLFAGGVLSLGMPPSSVIVFVALNTFMVGVSEEVMFRGVLFRAFDKVLSIWPAIILTSILFGAVHTLNVFITGQLGPTVIQSIAAGMSGIVFMAILIRTGSIWPAIVYHFLWDCLLFLLGASFAETKLDESVSKPGAFTMLAPILLNLPNFIFAFILLRHVGKQYGDLNAK